MGKLLNTEKVTMSRRLTFDDKSYFEIPAVGDGNCALNAMALGVIDLIKRDQLNINAYRQQKFIEVLCHKKMIETLEARLKLYRTDDWFAEQAAYEDLVPGLEKFIAFIKQKNLTYAQLVEYIKQNSQDRLMIAALHIGLAPALRYIGAELYRQQLVGIGADEASIEDAKRLQRDSQWSGLDVLMPLARNFFGVNLQVHSDVDDARYSEDPIPGAPIVNIIRVEAHWNYAVPVEQEDGLAAVLPPPANALAPVAINKTWSLDELQSLVEIAASIARQVVASIALTVAQLNEAQITVKNAVKNLLKLGGESDVADKVKGLTATHVASTTSIMAKVREKLDFSDKKIKSYKLGDMQKQILRGEYKEPEKENQAIAEDERLARMLQEAEVLSFLKKKGWSSFFRKAPAVVAAKPVENIPSVAPRQTVTVI